MSRKALCERRAECAAKDLVDKTPMALRYILNQLDGHGPGSESALVIIAQIEEHVRDLRNAATLAAVVDT